MSHPPAPDAPAGADLPAAGRPPNGRRRPGILAVVAAAVLALGVAGVLGGAFYLSHRHQSAVAIPVVAGTSSNPAGTPTPKTGAACVPGIWRQTSSQMDATINGVSVRLTSSGGIQHFYPDGSLVIDLTTGVTATGTANGDTYTVTSTGTLSYHYQVVGNQILYSDYKATGTTVWQRNGRQIDKQDLKAVIGNDTFTCTGGKLVEYGEAYSTELVRAFG